MKKIGLALLTITAFISAVALPIQVKAEPTGDVEIGEENFQDEEFKTPKIELRKTNVNLYSIGQIILFRPTITPNNVHRTITWTTSNENVASVDVGEGGFGDGVVTAKGAGTATITCTATDGSDVSISASCTVKVMDYTPTEAFSARLYEVCLGREPDEAGLAHWNTVLVNKERSGAQVAYGFVFSKEYQLKNASDEEYVEMLYNVFLDRPSDREGMPHWLNVLSTGVSREYVFRGFAESQEFTNICKAYNIERGEVTLSQERDQNPKVTAYVNRMYTEALGRAGEEDGLNHWCNTIQTGVKTPEQVAESFILSNEFKNKKLSDEEYVKVLYRTFMGREYDQSGLEHWLGELKRGCTREEILHRFATSQEFRQIQSSFGL